MLTRRALNMLMENIVQDMFRLDVEPEKIILFGSYANGGIHAYSDVDLAVWSKKFTGEGLIDFEIVRPLIKKYKNLDIKMFPSGATSENFDPFIDIIEKTGKTIPMVSKTNLSTLP
jgi:predicted nucleotidyltransferase